MPTPFLTRAFMLKTVPSGTLLPPTTWASTAALKRATPAKEFLYKIESYRNVPTPLSWLAGPKLKFNSSRKEVLL